MGSSSSYESHLSVRPPSARRFQVAAIFYSGMYEYDQSHAYVMLETAQEFFDLGGALLTNGDGLLVRGRTLYVVQNRSRANQDDVRVRQALAHALDQEAIIEVLGGEGVTPPTTFGICAVCSARFTSSS